MKRTAWNGFCPAGKHGLDYRDQPCGLCAKRSHHKQPPPLEAARARIDAERERARVVAEFAASLVEVPVRAYRRRVARAEMHRRRDLRGGP